MALAVPRPDQNSDKNQASVNRREVEKYLTAAVNSHLSKIENKLNEEVGKSLVEKVNLELSAACPSTEGFRFVVQTVVQEQWGQGSLVGARCLWDNSRDLVVSVARDTDKISLTLSVFFVANEEEEESDLEED